MKKLTDIIVDSDRIITKDHIPQSHLTDGLKSHYGQAEILVYPKTTDEVAQLVKYANQNNLKITTRGAGTNLVGSTIPNGGMIIDLSLMNAIIELDKSTFTVTVQSGILLQDLQQFVEKQDLFYSPDPGAKNATVGGNISTNAGGMRAVKYGVTRDYVQALEVVMADGTVLNIGSKNIKDNTGLSLKHLFIGSEGTLGIITQCTLKLIAKPSVFETLIIGFNTIKQAVANITTILQTLTPTALEFVERQVAQWGERYSGFQFPLPDSKAYLIIMLDGANKQHIIQQRQQLLANLGDCNYFIAETIEQACLISKMS